MPLQSPSELFEVLGDDPTRLIGEAESNWLEFKSAAYRLNGEERDKESFELAKDVSAFANSGGGVIVIGVKTRTEPRRKVDVAMEITPVTSGAIDPEQMQAIIREWLYPPLNVEIRPHRKALEVDKEIWTIWIQPQRERDSPFIVQKGFSDEGGTNRWLFAVYERAGAENVPYPPSVVQQWTHVGYTAASIEEYTVSASIPIDADEILGDDLRAIGQPPSASSYYLQAAPVSEQELAGFHEGALRSMADALWQGKYHLRDSGFNLPDQLKPDRTRNNALRVVWPENDSVSVTARGLATAIEGQRHLCWGAESVSGGAFWVNPLALVEFTLDFCRFYVAEVSARFEVPMGWRVRAGMRNVLEPEPLFLPPELTLLASRRARPALRDSFDFDWSPADEDPNLTAFAILKKVYAEFGFDANVIPYADGARINQEAILSLRS